jgi:hypothetical protein
MNCFSNLPYSPVLFFIRFSDYGQRPGIHWQILNNRNVKCTRIELANKYFLPSSPPSTPPPCRCCPRPQSPSCLSLRRQTLLIWMQKLGQSWAFCGSMSSPAHLPPPFWWQWWLSCVESGAAAWEVSCGGSNISLSCIHLPMRFASRVVSHSAKLAAKLAASARQWEGEAVPCLLGGGGLRGRQVHNGQRERVNLGSQHWRRWLRSGGSNPSQAQATARSQPGEVPSLSLASGGWKVGSLDEGQFNGGW